MFPVWSKTAGYGLVDLFSVATVQVTPMETTATTTEIAMAVGSETTRGELGRNERSRTREARTDCPR
jgi:hypothetical protein